MNGLSIMHIEDELDECVYLVNVVKALLEDLIEAEGHDFGAGAIVTLVASSGTVPVDWVAYSLTIEQFPKVMINYVLVRPFEVPAAAKTHLLNKRTFILDVLRMDPETNILDNYVDEALRSIADDIRDGDNLAYFTAFQGQILRNPDAREIRRIGKGTEGEIQRFLASSVADWMSHDEVLA